jgi:predicted  nucleic acid-binding Zn-ribbon protein
LNAQKVEVTEGINGLETRHKKLIEEFLDLRNKKEDLERRILEIKQKNPNLSSLEELQANIEKLISEKQTLTRQIADFSSQLEDLVTKKEALSEIPPKLEKAKIELDTVTQKVISQQETLEDLKSQDRELKREREKLEIEAQNYKQQLSEAKAEIVIINGQKEQLVETNNSLANRKQELERAIPSLSDREQEIQRRIAVIQEKNPNLDTLEELQKQIEKIRLEKSGLQGEKEALQLQVKGLATKKDELQIVEAQLLPKQTKLKETISQIEQLKIQAQGLEKQATELELLRVTYDALSSEKNSFETRIDQLRPEIAGLEAQKQQILQAIRENESEYNKVEQQREELRRLNSEIRSKYAELQDLKRNVSHTQGILTSLEEEKARLEEKITKLKQHIIELKAEIEELKAEIERLKNSNALKALRKPLWDSLPQDKREIDTTEEKFISGFIKYLEDSGFTFSERVIKAFHTSLKVQDISALVILAGISGTGKSQLPQRYVEYIGAQQLTLAVQPRWDSPQDLQGFYNYMEKKYKPTDLMRGLYQYQNKFNKQEETWERRQNNDPMKDRLVIVLLDEMNLARVEYYFSDFLSKLENKVYQTPYLELDVGSLNLPKHEIKLAIPQQFLFVGTMNEDETTQSLSDKVLDRANVLTFGKPEKLKLREEFHGNENAAKLPEDYISYSQFEGWMRSPDPDSQLVKQISSYLERANTIMDKLGHPFAHRVYQAIVCYVVNYPGVVEENDEAFNAALADQFGQKLLPKLRGLMLDECHEELEEFSRLIDELKDEALIKAFATARDGRFGQFHWRGFVYIQNNN